MNENGFEFPYITLTIFLAITTYALLSVYSTVHWPILRNAHNINVIVMKTKIDNEVSKKDVLSKELNEIETASQKIIAAGHKAMSITSLYHFTGLSALILSIVALFRKKGWKRYVALPFGFLAGLQGIIVM